MHESVREHMHESLALAGPIKQTHLPKNPLVLHACISYHYFMIQSLECNAVICLHQDLLHACYSAYPRGMGLRLGLHGSGVERGIVLITGYIHYSLPIGPTMAPAHMPVIQN